MTPEETKAQVENRLRELGWSVHIGSASYEKISRFTGGSEAGISQLCHKLVSLGALQESREITDEVVEMAMLDLGRAGEGRAAARGSVGYEVDWGSIEQLAAELETKATATNIEPAPAPVARYGYAGNGAATAVERPDASALPKIVLVDPRRESRARFTRALSEDFNVVEAADGDEAWQVLCGQPDVELLVTDLALPKVDGYGLIRRLREATSPPHLVSMPIIVITGPENASAKMRVLMAGANDFITKADPSELRARALARYKLNKTVSRIAVAPASTAARTTAYGTARAPASPGAGTAPFPARPATTARAPLANLTAERRYGAGSGATRPARVTPKDSAGPGRRRANSTTTITVGATMLLAFAIVAIFYVGPDRENLPTAPQVSMAPQPAAPPEDMPPVAEPERNAEPERSLSPPVVKSTPPAETKDQTAPPAARREAPAPSPPERTPPSALPEAARTLPREVPRAESSTSAPEPGAVTPPAPATAEPPRPAPPTAPAVPAVPPEQIEAAELSPNREELARAESSAPPATAKPAHPPNRISRDELSSFVTRFASVYEAGDLEQFMSLFAENARTNDRNNRSGIRQDYESLFRTTDQRQMKLGEISWEVDGNQAQGWGEFDVAVRRRGDRQPYLYTGSLTLVVEKIDGRLRIVRLYHGQRRVES